MADYLRGEKLVVQRPMSSFGHIQQQISTTYKVPPRPFERRFLPLGLLESQAWGCHQRTSRPVGANFGMLADLAYIGRAEKPRSAFVRFMTYCGDDFVRESLN